MSFLPQTRTSSHVGYNLIRPNPASDGFGFKLFARPDPPSPSIRDTAVHYDVKTAKMSHEKILLYDSKTGENTETVSIGSIQR